jgi:hypothetical protein
MYSALPSSSTCGCICLFPTGTKCYQAFLGVLAFGPECLGACSALQRFKPNVAK